MLGYLLAPCGARTVQCVAPRGLRKNLMYYAPVAARAQKHNSCLW